MQQPSDSTNASREGGPEAAYLLDAQVGFLLRVLYQRNSALLAAALGGLTTTQWAALSKLAQVAECSQNLLGRSTAMDAATIKGVVDRLLQRGLLCQRADPAHKRRVLLSLSDEGRQLYAQNAVLASQVSDATLANFTAREKQTFLRLLNKAAGWPAQERCNESGPA